MEVQASSCELVGRRFIFIAGSFGKVQTEDSTVLKEDDDDDDDDDDDEDEEYKEEEEEEEEEEEVVVNDDDDDDDDWVVSDSDSDDDSDSILFEYPGVSDVKVKLFLSLFLGENLETENSVLKKT